MQSAGGGHARAEIHQLPNPKCAGAFMGHSTRRPVHEWQKKMRWQQRMKFLKAKHKIGRLIPSFLSPHPESTPLLRFKDFDSKDGCICMRYLLPLFLRRIFPSAAFVCFLVGEIALLPQKNTRRRVTNKQTSASTALWVFFFITLNVVVYM
jgi:hypothetical protein